MTNLLKIFAAVAAGVSSGFAFHVAGPESLSGITDVVTAGVSAALGWYLHSRKEAS